VESRQRELQESRAIRTRSVNKVMVLLKKRNVDAVMRWCQVHAMQWIRRSGPLTMTCATCLPTLDIKQHNVEHAPPAVQNDGEGGRGAKVKTFAVRMETTPEEFWDIVSHDEDEALKALSAEDLTQVFALP